MKLAYILVGVALLCVGIFLMQATYGQIPGLGAPKLAIYVDQSATYITYGQTATFTAQADWTNIDYYNWYLDDEAVVINDVGQTSTYTPPANLSLGQHTVECVDYTGQTSGVLYLIVGQGPISTPTPGGFSAGLSPGSVGITPGLTQTVTLTVNGGYPAFTVYWSLDGTVKSTVTINTRSASYQLPPNLARGQHTLEVEVVDFTQRHAVSNVVSISVLDVLPTTSPSHSPNPSTSASPSPNGSSLPIPPAVEFGAGALISCVGIGLTTYGSLSKKR